MEDSIQETSKKVEIIQQDDYTPLNEHLQKNIYSKIVILVDTNTHDHCLSRLLNLLETKSEIEVVEITPGEQYKNIETCDGVWKTLSDLGCDRKSLLINLGGGVVTDMGGFIAATFKRGISFINIPTTLLAMVDAAVGGKTGVNLGNLKNQIGVIQPAELVLIDTTYLHSLSAAEMRSGLAEMLKHGLIQDEKHWKDLSNLKDLQMEDLDLLIQDSIRIKEKVVAQDPQEQHLRKCLNFGHTFGHAIESYFLDKDSKEKLLHGEAVAAGIVLEAFLSSKILGLPSETLEEISKTIISIYGRPSIEKEDQEKIIDLLKYDKKNESGKIYFVLLKGIGIPEINCEVPTPLLHEAFSYYSDIQ